MSCPTPIEPCGCQFQQPSQCVFYNSEKLNCLNVEYGTDLETILKKIDAIICELNPETQIVYSVQNLDGYITVTPSGTNPKVFTVGLSSSFMAGITAISNGVTNINTFLTGLSFNTTTPGLTGSWTANALTVNYTPPASTNQGGGIIYNNGVQDSQVSGTAVKKNFVSNLISSYGLKVGEVIKIKATFSLSSRNITNTTECALELPGNIYKLSNSLISNSTNPANGTYYSYDANVDITVLNLANAANNAIINGVLRRTLSRTGGIITPDWYDPGSQISGSVIEVSSGISVYTQIDWTNFDIKTRLSNGSSDIAYNKQLFIELIKLK